MFRDTILIWKTLSVHPLSNQRTEARIGCEVSNRVVSLGTPIYVHVSAAMNQKCEAPRPSSLCDNAITTGDNPAWLSNPGPRGQRRPTGDPPRERDQRATRSRRRGTGRDRELNRVDKDARS
jgi:hypothetical protein